MVVLNRIYTRTGDTGETALGSGRRVLKSSRRIAAFGTVDETNATVGLVRLHTATPDLLALDAMLGRIQNDLFDLGADLCVPQEPGEEASASLRMTPAQADRLEQEIDAMNAALGALRSFVLPGGHPAAAFLHLARTVARRAERLMVELAAEPGEIVGPPALVYINRLSDFFFVASRHVNAMHAGDILWVKGAHR